MYNICLLFLLFMIYSFLGWLMEVLCKLFQSHKFINRGFLIGPYCPIYGWGSIFLILFLHQYQENPILLFCMAIIICSLLEYLTSYVMEKLFHARWWDYSSKKLNLNGRICLETMIPFGILGCIVLYVMNPFFVSVLTKIPNNVLNIVAIFLFIIYLIDNIISTKIILKFCTTMKIVEKDATEEITKKVKEIFLNRGILYKRLVRAFPNIKTKKEYLLSLQEKVNSELTRLKKQMKQKKKGENQSGNKKD